MWVYFNLALPNLKMTQICKYRTVVLSSEMWFLFNVNENPGLTVFELEKGIVEMTQTGDLFDRYILSLSLLLSPSLSFSLKKVKVKNYFF